MTLWAVIVAAAVAVIFSAVMLLSRSLYVSAVGLLVVLLQTGAVFLLRGAALLGFLQVMVYAGAVMVLVVITIMASGGAAGGRRFADMSLPLWLAAFGLVAVAAELVLGLTPASLTPDHPVGRLTFHFDAAFPARLFTSYAPATEAVTLLMFLAALAVLPDKETP